MGGRGRGVKPVNAVEPIIPKHMQDFLDAWRTAEAEGYECVIHN